MEKLQKSAVSEFASALFLSVPDYFGIQFISKPADRHT